MANYFFVGRVNPFVSRITVASDRLYGQERAQFPPTNIKKDRPRQSAGKGDDPLIRLLFQDTDGIAQGAPLLVGLGEAPMDLGQQIMRHDEIAVEPENFLVFDQRPFELFFHVEDQAAQQIGGRAEIIVLDGPGAPFPGLVVLPLIGRDQPLANQSQRVIGPERQNLVEKLIGGGKLLAVKGHHGLPVKLLHIGLCWWLRRSHGGGRRKQWW